MQNNFRKQEKFCEDIVLEKDYAEQEISSATRVNDVKKLGLVSRIFIKLYVCFIFNAKKRRQVRNLLLEADNKDTQ